ncbi:MAG: hypothetical protein KKE62_16030 [Proteobacteria bacterium]|nr:hypothetical protein [Pseudomonadota bacterium]MBU1387893.1 hypothetical protein [Pseudomonadota bacterium]MBU1544339.1 hypothetical protein [Pseudomonadota bacterium]MBU2429319.1 hypothetical protein [Pseudomonadota bacterium]
MALLTKGLISYSQDNTARQLGDRSLYVGMSYIGKGMECILSAVVGKTDMLTKPDTGCDRDLKELARQKDNFKDLDESINYRERIKKIYFLVIELAVNIDETAVCSIIKQSENTGKGFERLYITIIDKIANVAA